MMVSEILYGGISLSIIGDILTEYRITYWIFRNTRCALVRMFGNAALCSGGTSVITGRGTVHPTPPPYSHVEQALRNNDIHAFSKVLRYDVIVEVQV